VSWLVVRDFIAENAEENAEGMGNGSERSLARLKAGEGTLQRHYDDDGYLYYEILVLGDNEFQALEDFSMPDSGCTTVKYKDKEGKWVQL
jgi:hypothetical protein